MSPGWISVPSCVVWNSYISNAERVSCLGLSQIEGLAGGQGVGPVAGADVVGSSSDEAAGRSEESVDGARAEAITAPAEDEWHVVGVCESGASADIALYVAGEIVLCEGKRGGCGVAGAQEGLLLLTQIKEFMSMAT